MLRRRRLGLNKQWKFVVVVVVVVIVLDLVVTKLVECVRKSCMEGD